MSNSKEVNKRYEEKSKRQLISTARGSKKESDRFKKVCKDAMLSQRYVLSLITNESLSLLDPLVNNLIEI